MKKLCLVCLVVVFLTLLSPVALAWTETASSGDWTQKTRETWQGVIGQDSGSMTWENLTNLDFAGYHAVWNFSYLGGTSVWYLLQQSKFVTLEWNISNVYIYASAECLHELGGVLHNDWLYGGSAVNNSGFAFAWWNWWSADLSRTHVNFQQLDSFELFVSQVDNTHILVELYAVRQLINVCVFSNSLVVDADYWDSVDVRLTIMHSGGGQFLGYFSDTIYLTSYEPDAPVSDMSTDDNPFSNFFGNIYTAVGHVLPSWLKETLDSFAGYFVWLVPIANIVISGLALCLPLLPYVFTFYAIDVGVTSVATGSFVPVGAFVMSMYEMATALAGTVVSIAGVVYDFIHFW